MSEGQTNSPSNFMTWIVEERKESEAKPSRPPNYGVIVPMIPSEILSGSDTSRQTNPLVQRALSNPFVPVGMVATVGCLIGMCKATMNRDQYRAQLYMRGRVAAQFFTICVLVGGALYLGFKPPSGFGNQPGAIPAPEDALTKRMLNRNP